MEHRSDLRLTLLNPWQRGFPLVREPFAHIAGTQGLSTAEVLAGYARLQEEGALSRIGGVFAGNAGGAALLAAMAVPPERLDAVAAVVSSHPGVNHNYQREHHFNLWFVMTGQDDAAVRAAMRSLEEATGLSALQLRMQRAYRIDLGFDLRGSTAPTPMAAAREATPVLDADRPLAALLEDGVPLVPLPGRNGARHLVTVNTFGRDIHIRVWKMQVGRVPVYLLDELSKQAPEGVYLTSIKQNGNAVTVSGVAQTNERVSEFLRNTLYNSPWLEKPELVEIKAASVTAQGRDRANASADTRRLFDFTLRLTIKRPPAPADAASDAAGGAGGAARPAPARPAKAT